MKEIIIRAWRFVYSNSHEEPFSTLCENNLYVKEANCEWEARRIFWRFYFVTSFTK